MAAIGSQGFSVLLAQLYLGNAYAGPRVWQNVLLELCGDFQITRLHDCDCRTKVSEDGAAFDLGQSPEERDPSLIST